MARKYHHSRRGLIPKTTGGKIGLLFKVIGGVAVAGPAISGTIQRISTPDQIPQQVVYNYTGYSMNDGSFNAGALQGGITAVAVGAGLMFFGKWLGKVIR